MNKSKVIKKIAEKVGISTNQANHAIFALFSEIRIALLEGDTVNLNEIGKFIGEIHTEDGMASLSIKYIPGSYVNGSHCQVEGDGIPF